MSSNRKGRRSWNNRGPEIGSAAVVVGAVAISLWMILLSQKRSDSGKSLSTVETALFQTLILLLGLGGSYYFGRLTSRTPNARSAFRRIVSLYKSLSRFLETINERRELLIEESEANGTISTARVLDSLTILDVQIREQLQTVDDAVEDWKDLAPNEVSDLVHDLRSGGERDERAE